MAYRNRPSLLGALLWTGLGTLFLLHNFGIVPDFWSLAGRYWPVLLILLGLGKIVDYFLHKDAMAIRIGEIFGIFLLLLIGSAITRIHDSQMGRIIRDFPFQIGDTQIQLGQWLGDSYTYTEEATYPVDISKPIRIENSYGSVSVVAGSEGEIHVRLKKVVYASEPAAKDMANTIHLETETSKKDSFVIRTNRESLKSENILFNTNFEISVPKNSQVKVQNTYGEIRVAGINGNLDLATTHRLLEVRDCTGQFTISNRYAEARLTNLSGNVTVDGRGKVYMDNIRGDVTLTNEYSPIEIYNVEGKASVSSTDGSIKIENISKPVVITARGAQVQARSLKETLKVTAHHGRIDLSDINANVLIESRYTALTLKDIRGNVDINSNSDQISADSLRGNFKLRAHASSILLNEIRGDVDIQTALKEVLVTNLEGKCAISNEYADVRVSTRLPLATVDIRNRSGEVELFLPEQAAFALTATARNGKIITDYPGLSPAGLEGDAAVLRSQMRDGGPRIMLQTQFGNIRISRTAEGGKSLSASEESFTQRRPRREYRRSFSMEASNPGILANSVSFFETFLWGAR
jgi:hypothetical protein